MNPHAAGAPRVRPGARRPLWAKVCIAVGTAALLVTGLVACQKAPPGDVGAATVSALASAQPTGSPTAPAAASGSSAVAVRDGALPTTDDVVPPTRLRIAAMKLDATVAAVGVDRATGDFDVPPSVDRVGWYRFGPGLESDSGSIVIAGHVDSAAQGKGAFFRLGSLSTGDRITLTGNGGTDRAFTVVGRERYEKTRIPLDKYFARTGALRLTLITCGGPFDAATGHYRDNVVITATPAKA